MIHTTTLRWAFACLTVLLAGCQCGTPNVGGKQAKLGDPCKYDEDCETGLCESLPGEEKKCLRKCSDGCGRLEVCEPLAPPRDRYACVPDRAGLCQGCATDADCTYPGDSCLQLGGGLVCGRDCSYDGTCPFSFRCSSAITSTGASVAKQCQPNSGTCECTVESSGQTLPCQESNSFGTCDGVRTCVPPNGYDACSAHVPTTEECNGRDDDCDGLTDEDLGDESCGMGECRRTVARCANGIPQTCVAGMPQNETCDGRDNDCDGQTDEDFNLMTSLDHCGACNTPCQRAHATAACTSGMCGIATCDTGYWNADGNDANGCEYQCTLTNGGVEICDSLDNNCNGTIDEGFMLATDPRNCGMCGRVCNVSNGHVATYSCSNGQCGIATCVTGYDDCDQVYATGCEQTVNDINNCGACNNQCMLPHATPACTNSMCAIASCDMGYGNCNMQTPDGCETDIRTNVDHCNGCNQPCPSRPNASRTCNAGTCGFMCLPNYWNNDGIVGNGCEYQCTYIGADTPDLGFVDANCDGIDGDRTQAIFVDIVNGNDTYAGTMTQPKRSIGSAIAAADAAVPKKAVYVSKGDYPGQVTLRSGVSVYGGYDAANGWSRSNANLTTIASTTTTGVLAQDLGLGVTVQFFTVTSANATTRDAQGDGESSYGVRVINSTSGVTLEALTIRPGAGFSGADGNTGGTGGDGSQGGNASATTAGSAGASTCGAPGGVGGAGVSGRTGGNPGGGGTTAPGGGPGASGGSGGTSGDCDFNNSSSGGDAPAVQASGTVGSPGVNGYAGASFGVLTSQGLYQPVAGGVGEVGKPGGGGGGGGAGGGTEHGTNFVCSNCSGMWSGGGGGGGGGGCGGSAGGAGRGGGGSIGVVVVDSTVTLLGCTVVTQAGATGGRGGNGGSGGSGGPPGAGANGEGRGSCSSTRGGNCAAGSSGGQGGQGGGAAGGTGGPSVCVVYRGMLPTTIPPINCSTGMPGNGGPGGTNGAQSAPAGVNGIATNTQQSM